MSKNTRRDIRKYNKAKNAWVVLDNKVYDITKYLSNNPAERRRFAGFLGKDVTLRLAEKEHNSIK
jgi:cytochrome b involved in lipid metabolism